MVTGETMFNRRTFKKTAQISLAALAATALDLSMAMAQGQGLDAQDAMADFKFPIVLCRFKQAMLRESEGKLKLVVDSDWGPEQAFAVGNVRSINTRTDNGSMIRVIEGEFAGDYAI